MARVLSKEEWKRRRKMIRLAKKCCLLFLVVLTVVVFLVGMVKIFRNIFGSSSKPSENVVSMKKELDITELFLTPNEYSRPQLSLSEVKGIVLHYPALASSTAVENRNYYESLKSAESREYASTHFIIGLDGEIVQCIPLNEIAYASGAKNEDSISIEFCHPGIDGEPNEETRAALLKLVTYLCNRYSLKASDVVRHYDISGVSCPKYYVENESAWKNFLDDVEQGITKKQK